MTAPDLKKIMNRVYDAVTLRRGGLDAVQADFAVGMNDTVFASAARDRLQQLVDLERRVGASELHLRDYVGSVHLRFLRDQMTS